MFTRWVDGDKRGVFDPGGDMSDIDSPRGNAGRRKEFDGNMGMFLAVLQGTNRLCLRAISCWLMHGAMRWDLA